MRFDDAGRIAYFLPQEIITNTICATTTSGARRQLALAMWVYHGQSHQAREQLIVHGNLCRAVRNQSPDPLRAQLCALRPEHSQAFQDNGEGKL
jgi:hypothetical protein